MLSPSSMKDNFRPRLSRFDRPAISVEELFQAEGGDFVHIACWTTLGRRATLTEFAQWFAHVELTGDKIALLSMLRKLPSVRDVQLPTGLRAMLAIQQRSEMPLVGPLLTRLSNASTNCKALNWVAPLADGVLRKVRCVYRHGKMRLRAGAAITGLSGRPLKHILREQKRRPAPDGTPQPIVAIYADLCKALDAKAGKR